MKSNLAAPPKIKDRVTIRSSSSEYIPERIEGRVLKRDLYTYLPWVGKIPLEKEMRKWQPTLVFLPGKSHGQRSLVGHNLWGCKRVRHSLGIKQQQCYPAIPFLSINLKESKAGSWREICTFVFIAALFTIATVWDQPKYSLADEWISKLWCMHTMKCYSALKRKEGNFDTCYNLDDIMWRETSQSQRRQIVYDSTYMRHLK